VPEICLEPGAPIGCGACFEVESSCAVDEDCAGQGPTSICEPILCACTPATACALGCVNSEQCSPGEICGPTYRCEPKPCQGAADCPVDFTCDGGECARKTCSLPADCKGYCVNGACYDTPGSCVQPLP
jgi:hypothetical protein